MKPFWVVEILAASFQRTANKTKIYPGFYNYYSMPVGGNIDIDLKFVKAVS